jgi:hypothetical protein
MTFQKKSGITPSSIRSDAAQIFMIAEAAGA